MYVFVSREIMFKLSWDFHVYQVINHMKQFVHLSIIFALNACKRHVTNFLTLFTMFTNNYVYDVCFSIFAVRFMAKDLPLKAASYFPFFMKLSLHHLYMIRYLTDNNLISSYIFISLIMLMKANVDMHNFVKWAPNENCTFVSCKL